MKEFVKGRYRVRLAASAGDIQAAQALRHRAFFGREGLDRDRFDARCDHVLVERDGGHLAGCFRLLLLPGGAQLCESYSAQFYDLSGLARFEGGMLEMGRFCTDPALSDPDVLRVAWAALTGYVEDQNVKLLFGCASFAGVNAAPYRDSFAILKARHMAPERWRPKARAGLVYDFKDKNLAPADPKRGLAQMPPLLRSYLAMGGWVSDHAVIDQKMGTLHVFTGLEVGAIPAARIRLLRALAA